MKKFLLIALLSVFAFDCAYAQKIKVKREYDKFAKEERVVTSSETLFTTAFLGSHGFYLKVRAQKVGSTYVLHASIAMPSVVKYTENDGVMLLLDNKETIMLETMYTGVSFLSYKDGPITFETSFNLSESEVELLKKHNVTDVRINYMDGFYDRMINDKKRSLIKNMLNLLDSKN